MLRVIKIKNVQAQSDVYCGQTIVSGEYYTITSTGEADIWAANEKVNQHLWAAKIVVNDGVADILSPAAADRWLKNFVQTFQTTADQKLLVSPSPRPGNTTFQLTSRIDGTVGNNDRLHVAHTVFQYGQDTQGVDKRCGLFVDTGLSNEFAKYWLNSKYINFSTLGNRTYIFDGGLTWNGIGTFGLVGASLDVVPTPFNPVPYVVTPGSGNSFIVNGYIMLPHPTNQGTHNMPIGLVDYQTPQDLYFAEVKPSVISGLWSDPGFWNIEYNLVSKKFQNLSINPNPYGAEQDVNSNKPNVIKMVGNLFTVEITLASFIKDLLITGEIQGYFSLNSTDPYEIGYGLRLKLDTKTYVNDIYSNTRWNLAGFIKTYKEFSVG
jgi:hypothetical protein